MKDKWIKRRILKYYFDAIMRNLARVEKNLQALEENLPSLKKEVKRCKMKLEALENAIKDLKV